MGDILCNVHSLRLLQPHTHTKNMQKNENLKFWIRLIVEFITEQAMLLVDLKAYYTCYHICCHQTLLFQSGFMYAIA